MEREFIEAVSFEANALAASVCWSIFIGCRISSTGIQPETPLISILITSVRLGE
jgi:hypothetical protein